MKQNKINDINAKENLACKEKKEKEKTKKDFPAYLNKIQKHENNLKIRKRILTQIKCVIKHSMYRTTLNSTQPYIA